MIEWHGFAKEAGDGMLRTANLHVSGTKHIFRSIVGCEGGQMKAGVPRGQRVAEVKDQSGIANNCLLQIDGNLIVALHEVVHHKKACMSQHFFLSHSKK